MHADDDIHRLELKVGILNRWWRRWEEISWELPMKRNGGQLTSTEMDESCVMVWYWPAKSTVCVKSNTGHCFQESERNQESEHIILLIVWGWREGQTKKSSEHTSMRCTDTVVHILSSERKRTSEDSVAMSYLKNTGSKGLTSTLIDDISLGKTTKTTTR